MIARNAPTCCQLLFTPLCLLFKRLSGSFCPREGGDGRPLCASARSEKPLTAPLDAAVPPFFSSGWQISGAALITVTPFLPPSLGHIRFSFASSEPEAALCVSQTERLTFILRVL